MEIARCHLGAGAGGGGNHGTDGTTDRLSWHSSDFGTLLSPRFFVLSASSK
jgi:hypothetical protein